MAGIELPFTNAQRDRHGRIGYWYFRRNGRRWRLPGEPGSEDFMREYHRLVTATSPVSTKPTARGYPAGSIGALIDQFFASPEFRDTKPNTQRLYRMILEPLAKRIGHMAVAQIERRHVIAMRNERAETPGMANMVVRVMRLLLTFAVDNEYRTDNPAFRIKLWKLGEHRAWTEEECAAFEQRWPPGSMQRRAYMLAKCTGQRCGDLAAMTRAHRKDGSIRVVQEKTGKELWILELSDLTAELARGEAGHMSLLTKSDGSAFDGESLSPWFGDAIDKAKLPDDCVLHGLRKMFAKRLAEAGNSAHLIGSVTGHDPQSPEIVRYTRAADQRKMATAAILTLENAARTPSGKQGSGASGKRSEKA